MAILSSYSVGRGGEGRGGEGDERCMLHVRHESGGGEGDV